MERSPQGPKPDREDFGEAGLGEAQSEDPPVDPEMIDERPGQPQERGEGDRPGQPREGGSGVESVAGDQDAEGPAGEEPVDEDEPRDQAEGA